MTRMSHYKNKYINVKLGKSYEGPWNKKGGKYGGSNR